MKNYTVTKATGVNGESIWDINQSNGFAASIVFTLGENWITQVYSNTDAEWNKRHDDFFMALKYLESHMIND